MTESVLTEAAKRDLDDIINFLGVLPLPHGAHFLKLIKEDLLDAADEI